MRFIEEFLKSFFSDYSIISVSENDVSLDCSISSKAFLSPTTADIEKTYTFLQNRDKFIFNIIFGEADPISFSSKTNDYSTFIKELNAEYYHQKGELIRASITINKVKIENIITIYDLDVFIDTLTNLTIDQVFVIFNRILFNSNYIIFEVFSHDINLNSETIYFKSLGSPFHIQNSIDRKRYLEHLSTTCFFRSIENHGLIPNDFKILNVNPAYERLVQLFNHYTDILSIIYLFDITSINNNVLEFKINGYKTIKGLIDLTTKPIQNAQDYYEIYNWVYNGGNLIDKIGLARNIISLHFNKYNEIGLQGNTFQSIQSSYKIYEKQNIQQYIDIRNKISEQLLNFNERANKVVDSLASGLQKSAIALISFYLSAIIIKVLSKGELVNIFTIDITLISVFFLIISFFYFLALKWEVKKQIIRFNNSYINLKERYTDLLDKEDIQRILNNDKDFNDDLIYIDSKLKLYSKLWLSILGILLLLTSGLFLLYYKSIIINCKIWNLIYDVIQ